MLFFFFFFFNDTATTEIYTLFLHDALPISSRRVSRDDFGVIFCDFTRHRVSLKCLAPVCNLTSAAVTPNLTPWKCISSPSRRRNRRNSPANEDEMLIRWLRRRLAAIWRRRPAFSKP